MSVIYTCVCACIYVQREFSDTFKVWYDSFGGDAIGLTCGNNISSKVKKYAFSFLTMKLEFSNIQPFLIEPTVYTFRNEEEMIVMTEKI